MLRPPKAACYLQISDGWSLLTASQELHQRIIQDEDFWTKAFQLLGEMKKPNLQQFIH